MVKNGTPNKLVKFGENEKINHMGQNNEVNLVFIFTKCYIFHYFLELESNHTNDYIMTKTLQIFIIQ